jgi:putative CocE/NonD family hydrolase
MNTSRYLTMRDGTRIAIDLWLPAALSRRVPTLIRATRYWRAIGYADPKHPDAALGEARLVTGAGYALVLVDVRGSGASFGRWRSPWSRAEIADLGQVVDWVVEQPWSNGRVGAYGASYDGNTAELLGSLGRRAVRAVVPISDDFDPYAQNAFPGGILSQWFVGFWSKFDQILDRNDICALIAFTGGARQNCKQVRQIVTGVKPVEGDSGGRLLRAAVKQHAANMNVAAAAARVVFRDDGFGASRISAWSPYTYLPHLRAAVQAWVGWMDAGTVEGTLARYVGASGPQTVVIGPWSHGTASDGHQADPFDPPNTPLRRPTRAEEFQTIFRYLDRYLKGKQQPAPTRLIRYYTLGEGSWHTTTTWPPAGLTRQRWFFGADGSLTREQPSEADAADRYAVDFTATSGPLNRWHTQAGSDVVYPNRAAADKKLLTYTSAPLARALEITGHPVVTLEVTSTASDGAFIVYLEDVAPDGLVTYITEGELRALQRKISRARPPYRVFGPYHSFRRAGAQPLVPGRVAELRFLLWPTSVLIRKGHRIRVAIAGADDGTFARIPAAGHPVITVGRSRTQASAIDLPVRPR